MKKSTFLLSLFLIAIGLLIAGAYYYAVYSPYRISSEEAKKRISNHDVDLILDVRTDLERTNLGFYPGSVHIQSADLDREMPQRYPDKNMKILAYCNTGHRARMATDKLHALGYKNAVYISSGYKTIL